MAKYIGTLKNKNKDTIYPRTMKDAIIDLELATVATSGNYNDLNNKPTIIDTKNTAGSTDTSSKIFLVGAIQQAANPQTYSDNQVYATNGQLDANKVRVAEAVSLVYDGTNKCLNFNFA